MDNMQSTNGYRYFIAVHVNVFQLRQLCKIGHGMLSAILRIPKAYSLASFNYDSTVDE